MSELSETAFGMPSEASEAIPEDGEWLPKQEVASLLGVSEKTIENRVRNGQYKSEKRFGRAFIFVPNSEKASEDSRSSANNSEMTSEPKKNQSENASEVFGKVSGWMSEEIERLRNEIETLQGKVGMLQNDLSEARERAARLEGELSSINQVIQAKDETIQAKDQAINSANAAVMLMERQTPSVEVTPPERQLEANAPGWMFWKK
jgi:chromosome segregation ATPase